MRTKEERTLYPCESNCRPLFRCPAEHTRHPNATSSPQPFGQASSERRPQHAGPGQTNAASLEAGSRRGSGGHQAGWTTLSVHLLQREQRQCDEAYLDAHECTLRVCSIPSIAVQPGQHNAVTPCSLSTETSPEPPVCFQGNLGLQKVASSNCLLDGQKICTSWAALDITTRTSCPSIAASARGTLCFQHCCQRKRLTQCRSELPPR